MSVTLGVPFEELRHLGAIPLSPTSPLPFIAFAQTSQTTPQSRHLIGLVRPLRPLRLSTSALAVLPAAAYRQLKSPVLPALPLWRHVQGVPWRVSLPALPPPACAGCHSCCRLSRHTRTDRRAAVMRWLPRGVPPGAYLRRASTISTGSSSPGVCCSPTTSHGPSDMHPAYRTELRCPFAVSHDLEAFFRILACGLLSCRSHP